MRWVILGFMARWGPLRERLAGVEVSLTLSWAELDALVGGLPRSAYVHSAFWKGDRSGWPGFTTTDVRVGESVTFVRRGESMPVRSPRGRSTAVSSAAGPLPGSADLVLVGCVKKKLDHPAPARLLYVSDLFAKQRAYAERSGVPWFVLSAKHGLVAPDQVLAPYDLRLSDTSADYRRAWGARVVSQLLDAAGPLAGKVLEIHAGAAYADAISGLLRAAGATVTEPLHGLAMGQRLAWYNQAHPTAPSTGDLAAKLGDDSSAVSPARFLTVGRRGLDSPGLYSWWVDAAGAADLSAGLGHHVSPGLIYAGLAGATRARSGRKSSNTLWGRIRGMHLGTRHDFSTFRRSLGSVLAHRNGNPEIDEARLTEWMHQHLRVVTIPVEDGDTLGQLETDVLRTLDPPLNLAKVPATPLRKRLTELRRQHGHNTAD